MIKAQIYKYYYRSHNANDPEREFNFFATGRYSPLPPLRNGVDILDAIEITDLLDDCISDSDLAIRDRKDVRTYEIARFSVKLDIKNEARSALLGHNIEEFFTKDNIKKRKLYFRLFYGNRKFEGFVDIASINWDFTWLDGKDDIEFDVDDPINELFDGMEAAEITKMYYNSKIPYDDYFENYHFVYFKNNGTINYYIDRTNFVQKMTAYWGPDATKPIMAGFLQAKLIDSNPGYKVYDATLSFSRGIGMLFKLQSVDDAGEMPLEVRPFRIFYYFETDGFTNEVIENASVHRRAYKWYNKQHVLIPFWQLEGPTQPFVEAHYNGLLMTAEAQQIHISDFRDGNLSPHILKINAGAAKDMYQVANYQPTGTTMHFWVKDTYLLDCEYPYNLAIEILEPGTESYKPLKPTYCRCLVKDYTLATVVGLTIYQDDVGFPDIVRATTIPVYKYLCGDFKEKNIISIDFPPDSTLDVGSKVTFEGKEYRVERMYNFDIKKQRITLEITEI